MQRQPLALLAVISTIVALPFAATAADSATVDAGCGPLAQFADGDFGKPTLIDNKWLPMRPGTQFTLEGRANRGGGILPHQVVFTVTSLTKIVDGVRTVVVWDRDITEGALSEAELAFFAQDDRGNVWGLGEYPEEYEGGRFAGAPSTWIAGLDGAKPGVAMPGDPAIVARPYLQGSAPDVEFLDCARMYRTAQHACVPAGCYDSVLAVDEWSPLNPETGHQFKYHAPGAGVIQVGAVADPEGETLVLAGIRQLDGDGLAEANREAWKLDGRGRQGPEVYRRTAPAECAAGPCPIARR